MPLYPTDWLKEFSNASPKLDGSQILNELARIGLEEENLIHNKISGPLVVGQIKEFVPEPQSNGKTINWCQVDVGETNGGVRGIVCGAHNFKADDLVVVSLPGAVLPGDFIIAARKTYGHISDGMICSFAELGIPIESDGIVVLNEYPDFKNIKPGDDAIELLGLNNDVIELNITPDRGYCFSVRGVARELAGTLNNKFTDPASALSNEIKNNKITNKFALKLDSPDCDKFVAVTVENCNASISSPYYMQRRIAQAGMRPINLAVDATNYVMLELGQPLHAYDKDTLNAPIIVRKAKQGEQIKTLDGQLRALYHDDLLITDNKRLLGVAGVMGGFETEITTSTKNILIEAAHFNPVTVAKTARKHKLPSEASKRFERGVDYQLQQAAALKVAEILIQYGGGTITDISEVDNTKSTDPIKFDYDLTEKITGLQIKKPEQITILEQIGCVVKENNIQAPSWRPDLTIPEDLVEEISRIYGYDKIPSLMPNVNSSQNGDSDELWAKKMVIERAMANNGLYGVLSYSWTSTDVFEKMLYKSDDERRKAIKLKNPIDQNLPILRTSILQTLYKTMLLNFSRGVSKAQPNFGLFEVSNLAFSNKFSVNDTKKWHTHTSELDKILGQVPEQDLYIGAIIINTSLAHVLKISNEIFKTFGTPYQIKQADKQPWHPGKCAEYLIAGSKKPAGYSGQLHPSVCKNLDLPANTYALEINLSEVFASAQTVMSRPISTWPVAKTDLAFIVDKNIPAGDVIKTIEQVELVESVEIFDIYEGENVPSGKKSIAFAVNFRSADKTLSNDDVNEFRNMIIENIKTNLGGYLRDF